MKYKNKPMLSCAKLCTTFGSYYQVRESEYGVGLSVSLAPTPTCQPSHNLVSIASLGPGYYCIRFVSVCLCSVSDLG